jgi:histidyl-tRNA synthetase
MSQVSTKPASGFRDFLPAEMRKREVVFGTIRAVYDSFGFDVLDTPTLERLETLLGKYGDEGNQLIFKVLQRGEKLQEAIEAGRLAETELADMGLRYDLTVPLARVFAEYNHLLPRIFKRYQIAPVWRADRPARGRFREFYQCDVDVVGSSSMLVEAEVCAAVSTVLDKLGFADARIHINHRQLLRAVIKYAGIEAAQEGATLVAIDKLDKIGIDGVTKELIGRGIAAESIERLLPLLSIEAPRLEDGSGWDNMAVIAKITEAVGELEEGKVALAELGQVLAFSVGSPAAPRLRVDPFLARGLSYYTGPIFEIRSDDFNGSLGGGGRYDGLIGMFGKTSVPACGFSLGVERLIVLMEERGLFGAASGAPDVLVTQWSEAVAPHTLALAMSLRAAGLRVELYPDYADKYKKQFKFADDRKINVVVTIGDAEVAAGTVAIKEMTSGKQVTIPAAEAAGLIARIKAEGAAAMG